MSNQTVAKKADREAEKRREYIINIKRTLLPVATGILLGILSFILAAFASSDYRRVGVLILVLLAIGIYLHRWTLPLIGASTEGENLGAKDWLSIGFLVFLTWFVSWTLLLN